MSSPGPARRDPVAIVGLSCRLPGVTGPTQLWQALLAGADTVGTIPAERFDVEEWFDPEPGRPGRISTRAGGFLTDVDVFDAPFFGLSAAEAVRLDPQHRLALQACWDAVEDSGTPADRLAGTRTGVYAGCLGADHWDTLRAAGMTDMHAATGAGSWGLLPGRVSRSMDLRGPSLGVESTCSTSLLAVHLACRDLWYGETTAALVVSASLLLAPDLYVALSGAGILSASGRCRFGDADADGYVRSEGVVAVLLKPLAAARRDGDRVYATVLGSAVTNNGAAGDSLLAPGVAGQVDTLRRAYADACVTPGEVVYVEAHGAGTPRGDDTELRALATVLGDGRPADRPCLVGSVKSNLGHTEGAAGLAGLAKAALALHHRTVPPTLHVRRPHPRLGPGLAPARGPGPLPEPGVVGVSSFGLSATNVHVVLGGAAAPARPGPDPLPPVTALPLAARDPAALAELAGAYADLLDGTDPARVADLARAAGSRRTAHPVRLAAVGATGTELAAALRAPVTADTRPPGPPAVVFVFPGQGSQWPGMARGLLDTQPAFRAWMEECDAAVRAEAGWSPLDLLRSAGPLRDETVVQPALWAVQTSLAAAWQAGGVRPDVVVGTSMGEIAAATAAGALSVADAAAVVCRRSALIVGLGAPGAMVAVQVGPEEAQAAIGRHHDLVRIGVVNSRHATVLAGDPAALEEVVGPLRRRGVFCRPVAVRYASHAPQIEPLRAPLLAALAGLAPTATAVRMHSTVHGRPVAGPELTAGYWMDNLARPVEFAAAMRAVLPRDRPALVVEVSPHPILPAAIEDALDDVGVRAPVLGSLVRDEDDLRCLLSGLSAAYVAGCPVDWAAVQGRGRFVDLPRYPWRRHRYPAPAPLPRPGPAAGTAPAADAPAAPAPDPVGSAPVGSAPQPGRVLGILGELLAAEPDQLDRRSPLTHLGLDSLLAARLSRRARQEAGVVLPIRTLLDGRTLGQLEASLAAG